MVPGGFKWKCQETGQWVPARGSMPSYVDFIYQCRQHCIANNLPIGLEWEQTIQDQICATLDGQWCSEFGHPVQTRSGWSFDFQSVLQGTLTLGRFLIRDHGKKVEYAEAERRAAICVGCVYNQNPIGCTNCSMGALREAAKTVVNGEPTTYDSKLMSCKICMCNLKAKIHLPLNTLKKYMSEDQMSALPDFCWLK